MLATHNKLQGNLSPMGSRCFLFTPVYTIQTQNGIMFVTDGAFSKKASNSKFKWT
ncbi:hypothetical protein VCHA43P277_120038 [Vibrio chagasii]|nr:hypothetical protein VCHA34P126_100159 [Vibrio chagasii]CAH6797148.1 hypothetical protein VCHA36P161_100037 [Vibrio chagasii]CAH6797194.1 hypothetical protein VCHA35P150_100037 [Vibrio chagasii]CAH6806358.1 hypothetical protein VCHA34O109_110037 [Vibrio chagasii]CAH6843565.1 hypothetical protein VCHA29O39_10038 [Vibrio chagasii]